MDRNRRNMVSLTEPVLTETDATPSPLMDTPMEQLSLFEVEQSRVTDMPILIETPVSTD